MPRGEISSVFSDGVTLGTSAATVQAPGSEVAGIIKGIPPILGCFILLQFSEFFCFVFVCLVGLGRGCFVCLVLWVLLLCWTFLCILRKSLNLGGHRIGESWKDLVREKCHQNIFKFKMILSNKNLI